MRHVDVSREKKVFPLRYTRTVLVGLKRVEITEEDSDKVNGKIILKKYVTKIQSGIKPIKQSTLKI